MAVISMPLEIGVSPSSVVGGTGTFSVSVSVNQAGGSIQLDTDHRSLLVSPSGSWPYVMSYPSGAPTSQTVQVTTLQAPQNTQVKLIAGAAGADMSNPANWSAVASASLSPATAPVSPDE